MTESDTQALANFLGTRRSHLYMLIDAAHDHTCPAQLRAQGLDVRSLFSGIKEITLAEVAPYLVVLPKKCEVLESLLRKYWGYGKCWSIIIEGVLDAEKIRLQLKKSLMIELDNGSMAYFRFYDSRAFEKFVAISNFGQMNFIFGDVVSQIYYASIGEMGSLMSLRRTQSNGWKTLICDNNYIMASHHRVGGKYVENIEQSAR